MDSSLYTKEMASELLLVQTYTYFPSKTNGGQHLFSKKYSTFYLSHIMRFPTMWYMRQANAQTSLRIRADWSEPLLVAWIFYDSLAADRTSYYGVSKLNKGLHRLVWVYTCQNTTLLENTCRGSLVIVVHVVIVQSNKIAFIAVER